MTKQPLSAPSFWSIASVVRQACILGLTGLGISGVCAGPMFVSLQEGDVRTNSDPYSVNSSGTVVSTSYNVGATYLRNNEPSTVKDGTQILLGTSTTFFVHPLLSFDVSYLTNIVGMDTSRVDSAAVVLTQDTAGAGGATDMSLHLTDPFDETTATWNDPHGTGINAGGVIGSELRRLMVACSNVSPNQVIWGSPNLLWPSTSTTPDNLVTAVRNALASTNKTVYFLAKRTAETANTFYTRIKDDANGAVDHRPELRVGIDSAGAPAETNKLVIESATLRAEFTRGMLTAVTNKLTGESYFGPDPGALKLARISRKQSQQEAYLNADDSTLVEITNGTRMILRNLGGNTNAQMIYDFRVDAASQDICFKITASLPEKGIIGAWWGADGIDSSRARLILPAQSGVEIGPYAEAGPGQEEYFNYGTAGTDIGSWPTDWNAQFAVVQGVAGGCWIRTQDTNHFGKTLNWGRSTNGLYMAFKSRATPPFEDVSNLETVEWRISAYAGDWTVPADQYKTWMTNAFALTPKSQREPLWMNDIRFVVSTPMETNRLDVIASHVDPTKTLLWVHIWAEEQFPGAIGYDEESYLAIHWPNPTPTQLFKDFVARAHQLGYRVMPYALYSSATFPDPLQTWPELYAGIAINPISDQQRHHGTAADLIAAGVVPTNYQIYILNPAYPGVREGLISSWTNIVHETGVDGIYWDFPVVVGFDHVNINGVGPRHGALEMMREFHQRMPQIAVGCENRYNELFANFITFPRDVAVGSNEDEKRGNYHPICSRLYSDYRHHSAFSAAPLPTVDFPQFLYFYQKVWKPFGNIPSLNLAASVPDWDLESVGPRFAMEEALALMENRASRNQVVEGTNAAFGAGRFIPGWPAWNTNGLVQGLNPARRYALVPGSLDPSQGKITELTSGVALEAVRSSSNRLAFTLTPVDISVSNATFYLECPGKPVKLFGGSEAGLPAVFQKVSDTRYWVSCNLPARVGALWVDSPMLTASTDLTTLPAFSGINVNGIVTEGRVSGGGEVVTTSSGSSLRSNVRAEASVWEYRFRLANAPCRFTFITRPHDSAHIVEVNGRELFREEPRTDGGYLQHEISLTDYAGQPVILSLIAERVEYPDGWYQSGVPLNQIPSIYWEAPRLSYDPVTSPDLIAFEPFNFSTTPLAGVGSGLGWSNNWVAVTGAGVRMSQDGVSLPYPFGAALTATGSRVKDGLGAVSSVRLLTNGFSLAAGNGPYYLSFLARKTAGGSFRIEAQRSSDNLSRWGVRVETDGRLGVSISTTTNSAGGIFKNDSNYLVVSKFQPGSLATVMAKLFEVGVDTVPSSESGLVWDVAGSGVTGLSQDQFKLTVSTGTVELDEFRLASAWQGVVIGATPVPVFTYEQWQGIHFTEAEQQNPAISGRYGTPAGDGVVNLLKYAFGLNPKVYSSDLHMLQAGVVGGELHATYPERAGVQDISYNVELSEDLVHWTGGYPGVEEIGRVANGDLEQVTVRAGVPAGAPKAFLRLAVREY